MLTQYIDPKTDGIIVAGGDGTLLEVNKQTALICRCFSFLSLKKLKGGKVLHLKSLVELNHPNSCLYYMSWISQLFQLNVSSIVDFYAKDALEHN